MGKAAHEWAVDVEGEARLRPNFPVPTWSRGLVQRAGAAAQTVALFVPLVTRPAIEIFRSLRASAAPGGRPQVQPSVGDSAPSQRRVAVVGGCGGAMGR